MKPKIFLTRQLPPEPMQSLAERCDLTWNREDRVLTRSEIAIASREVDGLLCLITDSIDADFLSGCSNLKVVSNYAVGFNNIDVDAATTRGIVVTNTPGVLTESTADMAFALLMATARRIVEGDQFVRQGKWEGWGPLQFLGQDVAGSTLGLIGFGRIGKAMARRAQGFSMPVLYWNRTRLSPSEERELDVAYAEMDEVLEKSDFLSLHVALTDQTRHLIGRAEIEKMKTTASIINTARGPVIDESALVETIRSGRIAGAGLDVYEQEPKLAGGLAELPSVVIAPHLGSATHATRTKMGMMAVDDCLAGCAGQRPINLVNPDVLT